MRLAYSDHPRLAWSSNEFALACYMALGAFMAVVVSVSMYLYATAL